MRILPFLFLIFGLPLAAVANPALIPQPCDVKRGEGSYVLDGEVKVSAADPGDALRLIAVLRDAGMKPVRVSSGADIPILRGDVIRTFEVEQELQDSYQIDDKDYGWMFTFIPVGDTTGLRYSSQLNPQ